MNLHKLILSCCLLIYGSLLMATPVSQTAEWNYFTEHFISTDGRVIDRGQNDMSHSEGQGYAMLLAVSFNDQPLFDKLWQWTSNNLQVRRDGLCAWGWGKRLNQEWTVIDYNNATDGDILIAYALIRAEQKWHQNAYLDKARVIVQSLRTHIALTMNNHSFLLSGYYGFADSKGLILNPSYQIFSAYQLFATIDDKSFWEKTFQDALFLVEESKKNKLGLPADWLLVEPSGTIKIFQDKSTRFSYEAIRVLLYLAWANQPTIVGVKNIFDYFEKNGRIPSWFDLIKDEISDTPAPAGFYAVLARVATQLNNENLALKLSEQAKQGLQNEQNNYYSYVLYLLSGIDA